MRHAHYLTNLQLSLYYSALYIIKADACFDNLQTRRTDEPSGHGQAMSTLKGFWSAESGCSAKHVDIQVTSGIPALAQI
jgi:hypothetical protein